MTATALSSLQRALLLADSQAVLYWVDDNCTDNSRERVLEIFPDARVVEGGGDLFWAGGMASALAAYRDDGAFLPEVLWLNDDVELYETALAELLEGRGHYPDAVLVGSLIDRLGEVTYGGYLLRRWTVRLLLRRSLPSGVWQQVDTMNGNVVLLPRELALAYGIDNAFQHGYADVDLGLRLRRAGVAVLLAPRPVGVCSNDHPPAPWRQPGLRMVERWSILRDKRHRPGPDRSRFLRRHAPRRFWLLWALPYVDVLAVHVAHALRYRKRR